MKKRPIIFDAESVRAILEGRKIQTRRVIKPQPIVGLYWHGQFVNPAGKNISSAYCPYGQPGDRLWVRETFALMEDITFYAADERLEPKQWPNGLWNVDKWCSPIYMPRWASRITLEVTGVRVERLQDISDEDICHELGCLVKYPGPEPEPYKRDLRGCFAERWDGLNAKRGFPWSSNPWTWCIEFKLM